MLFQFSQFGQKLPANIPTASHNMPIDTNTTTTAHPNPPASDEPSSWTGSLGYDKSTDGDLMHILFGLPDEYPTMATVHLHQWEQPASCTAPNPSAHGHEEQPQPQQQPELGMLESYDSPRFAAMVSTGMDSSLDLHFGQMDHMEGGEEECNALQSGSSSDTGVGPTTPSPQSFGEGGESRAESNVASSSHRKVSLGVARVAGCTGMTVGSGSACQQQDA
jgi:hypothetical protein